MRARPLDGLRVLDFTIAQQGPHATTLLALMGAEVVRVERTGARVGGYPTRPRDHHMVGYFAHSLGKKSITVDVRRPEGRDIVRRLAREVDAVTSNFRPGVMERLGLGFDDLRAENPRLVYVTGSGWGRQGPIAQRPSIDMVAQGAGGMMWMSGDEGSPPALASCALADHTGALTFCTAVLAALVQAHRTGVGEHIDTSLYGGQSALQAWEINASSLSAGLPRSGRSHAILHARGAIWRAFETADGWLTIAAEDAETIGRLCEAIGRPDLATLYSDAAARRSHADEIEEAVEQRIATESTAHWAGRLREHEIANGPVWTFGDVLADPHAHENGYLGRIEHPDFGDVEVAGLPITFDREPIPPEPPPVTGADTDRYLADIGYTPSEIAGLREQGVI